jgi:hypothetical protein
MEACSIAAPWCRIISNYIQHYKIVNSKLIQWDLNGKEKEGQASISHLNGAVLKSSAGIRRSMHFITG